MSLAWRSPRAVQERTPGEAGEYLSNMRSFDCIAVREANGNFAQDDKRRIYLATESCLIAFSTNFSAIAHRCRA